MSAARERIKQLLEESTRFNANDVLVHAEHQLVFPLDPTLTEHALHPFSSLIRSARETERESGILPLCVTRGILHWEIKSVPVKSPILLMPAVPLIDKIAQTVRFEFDPEDAIINPFVVNRLRQEFGIRIEDTGLVFEEVLAQLTTAGIQHFDQEVYMIGNFHHHRFEVIKELEELLDGSIAPHLAVLLGDESNVTQSDLTYSNQLLFPADPDQLDVYAAFRSENLVVQGPPGTGKSQVLANLLSKLIHAQYSALVISEKRVALEVIQRKLGAFGLDELCFVTTSETSSKEVISALKVAWKHYEQYKESPKQNLLLSEQYFHKLQLQLDLLNDSSLLSIIFSFVK